MAQPTTPGLIPLKLQPTTAVNSAGNTLRKSVSIGLFPQPPRGGLGTGMRQSSLPPSPLSGGLVINTNVPSGETSRRSSSETSPTTPNPTTPRTRKPKKKTNSTRSSFATGATPSLLNGSGEGQFISSQPGARGSGGLLSLPSPPQSRASSAQDSYSTTNTNYDEFTDAPKFGEGFGEANQDSKGELKGNVIVSVRVRPDASASEGSAKPEGEWMVDGRRSLIAYRGKEGGDYFYGTVFFNYRLDCIQTDFALDNVFATHDNNSRVYDAAAKRLVRRVMEGYHGTVFAYGMTGTGKTFSMQGTTTSPGVIPLAITDIFSYIRETPSREFLLRVSYLEIYNEKIHDLLSLSSAGATGPGAPAQEEIKLREDSKRGVYATPLKEEIVQSPTQLLRVIARGDQARRVAGTQFNARSSRSHAVVQIVVESRERIPGNGSMGGDKRSGIMPGGVRVSTLSLIDLAGSERAAETKERRTEGSHINKSLLTLGTVIARLSGDKDKEGKPTDKDGKHLPYRDSKLTRLLQGALSGDSLVSILCTIQIGANGSAATSNSHTSETLNTLKFASRAKNNIVSHAKKAEEALGGGGDGGARVLLERYRMEIQELRNQLESQGKVKAPDEDEEEEKLREREAEQRHEEQMLEMQLARTALKERIEHLNRLILSSKSTGVNAAGTYSSLGMHPRLSSMMSNSQMSSNSARSSMTSSTIGAASMHSIHTIERPASTASHSTLGYFPSDSHRFSNDPRRLSDNSAEDGGSESLASPGQATLAAQNRALQQDLADKTRYIAVLEKRLLQARRSSHSRASAGFSGSAKGGIMVGEDHNVSNVLKEKDDEIADLRARLDDKDRMLSALRSAARSRDVADMPLAGTRSAEPSSNMSPPPRIVSDGALGPKLAAAKSTVRARRSTSPNKTGQIVRTVSRDKKTSSGPKNIDEMRSLLDEMIEDRVVKGDLLKSARGSLRVPTDRERERSRERSRGSSRGSRESALVESAVPAQEQEAPPAAVAMAV